MQTSIRQCALGPWLLGLCLAGCGGADKGEISRGGATAGDPGSGGNPGSCVGTEMAFSGDVLVDPVACLAFSPRIDDIDWHATVSATEAEDGGCATACDEDETATCEELGEIDGFSGWRTPTLDELKDLSTSSPPYEGDVLDGELWTRETGGMAAGLAWAIDLGQPGMSVQFDKGIPLSARCVADAD
jgi:hypothetical protein